MGTWLPATSFRSGSLGRLCGRHGAQLAAASSCPPPPPQSPCPAWVVVPGRGWRRRGGGLRRDPHCSTAHPGHGGDPNVCHSVGSALPKLCASSHPEPWHRAVIPCARPGTRRAQTASKPSRGSCTHRSFLPPCIQFPPHQPPRLTPPPHTLPSLHASGWDFPRARGQGSVCGWRAGEEHFPALETKRKTERGTERCRLIITAVLPPEKEVARTWPSATQGRRGARTPHALLPFPHCGALRCHEASIRGEELCPPAPQKPPARGCSPRLPPDRDVRTGSVGLGLGVRLGRAGGGSAPRLSATGGILGLPQGWGDSFFPLESSDFSPHSGSGWDRGNTARLSTVGGGDGSAGT